MPACPSASEWPRRQSREHTIEWLLLCAGVVLLWATVAPVIQADGLVRYDAVRTLMRGELPETKLPLIQPALSVPLVYAGRLAYIGSWPIVGHFNMLLFLAFAWPIWRRLCSLYSPRDATRTLLLLLCASMLPHHLRHYYGEVLSALAVATGFLYAKERPVLAVALLVIGVANTPVLVVPVGVAALLLFRSVPSVMVAVAAAVLLVAAELYLKFGSVLDSPYFATQEKGYPTVLPYSAMPGFSYPAIFGVLSIGFSFGKGLLWFIPGLVAFVDQRVRQKLRLTGTPAGRALLMFSVSLVCVYASWWAWYGGTFWGPRFFLILSLPAALAMSVAMTTATTPARLMGILAILTFSSWVGVNGIVFDQASMDICWQNDYELEFLCWYVPEFSALWRPFVTHSIGGVAGAVWHSDQWAFALWQVVAWSYLAVTMVRGRLGSASQASRSRSNHASGPAEA